LPDTFPFGAKIAQCDQNARYFPFGAKIAQWALPYRSENCWLELRPQHSRYAFLCDEVEVRDLTEMEHDPSREVDQAVFLIEDGLYSGTTLRENDQERVTVYTKHRRKLH